MMPYSRRYEGLTLVSQTQTSTRSLLELQVAVVLRLPSAPTTTEIVNPTKHTTMIGTTTGNPSGGLASPRALAARRMHSSRSSGGESTPHRVPVFSCPFAIANAVVLSVVGSGGDDRPCPPPNSIEIRVEILRAQIRPFSEKIHQGWRKHENKNKTPRIRG
jgi:hypothetical protein